jgi:hypothetical protein
MPAPLLPMWKKRKKRKKRKEERKKMPPREPGRGRTQHTPAEAAQLCHWPG